MSRKIVYSGVLLTCVIAKLAVAAEPQGGPAAEKHKPEVLAEFTIEKGKRHILLPVRIEDREYLFMLDTGASAAALDLTFRELLGKPVKWVQCVSAGGMTNLECFRSPKAYVGKLDLSAGELVSCTDLEMVRRACGRDIRGGLGMGFLKNYVVRIDFDAGRLWLFSWDGLNHPEWGSAVPLYDLGGSAMDLPWVKANLAGAGSIVVLVDSGCSGAGSLARDVFEKAAYTGAAAAGLSETMAGVRRFQTKRISSLRLGGFEHPGLIMAEGGLSLIGLGVLARYVVTFDFPSMKMYLQKGKAFDKPDEADMSGLHLWRVGGTITVLAVDKDSPAAAAGITAEDVVLKVEEPSSAEMDIEDLRDLLSSGEGKEIKMTIQHGAQEKAVRFKLKRKI